MKKIVLIGLLLMFLVACAPAQPAEAPPAQPATEAAPSAPTPVVETKPSGPSEVTFGFVGPLTGDAASLGVPVKDAVVLAVEEVNANNAAGRKLNVVYEDDQCDPKKTTTSAQKLVGVDKVAAVIGPMCSGATLATAPIVEEAKVLLMSYSSTNPSIKDAGDYVFRNVPSDNGQGAQAAQLMQKLGYTKVAVIHIQNDWGQGLFGAFKTEAEKSGLKIVAVESYDSSNTDFRTQLAKIRAATPDVIYMLAHPADAGRLMKQTRQLGLKQQIVGADAIKDDTVLTAAGDAAEGLILTLPGVPKSPELEKFAAAYKAKYNKEFGAYTPEAYDVVQILAKACANTDCSSTAMKDYLYSMGEYKGASGTYQFDKDGEVQKSYDYFVVKDGKFEAYIAP